MGERRYVYHVTGDHGSYVFYSQQDAIQAINMLAPYHDLILDEEMIKRQLEKIGYYEKWPLSIQRVQEP